jgi:hypothetical protein
MKTVQFLLDYFEYIIGINQQIVIKFALCKSRKKILEPYQKNN